MTAPGQDIVAARAAGTLDRLPGNPMYTTLSGTSMATPHVAGAAAILAGKYPKWTPGQLKAALMATAAPRPELTVYQQGTGRIDVGRAVTQTVQASVGSLSLGYFPWPNDDAPTVHKTVTYTNAGSAPVTLTLDLAVAQAPAGMFAVSPPTLIVAAGRSATATVTVKPAKAPAGLYSGALTATGPGGTVVRTAIGAYQEPESYNLSITTLDRAGGPGASEVMIADVATGRMYFDSVMGALVRRLPAGRYTVAAATYDPARDGEASGHVTTAVRNVQLGRRARWSSMRAGPSRSRSRSIAATRHTAWSPSASPSAPEAPAVAGRASTCGLAGSGPSRPGTSPAWTSSSRRCSSRRAATPADRRPRTPTG